jgi:hypothetical protein
MGNCRVGLPKYYFAEVNKERRIKNHLTWVNDL